VEAVPEVRFRRAGGVFFRKTPRSLVALAAESDSPVRVEGCAAALWEMLETPQSYATLVAAASHAGAPAATIAGDVQAGLMALVAARLVVVATP
jgi:hypothetical protein